MRLKKLDKIRLVLLLPLSLTFIVLGTIALSYTGSEHQTDLSSQNLNNFLNTETEDVEAQNILLHSTTIPQITSSIPNPSLSPTSVLRGNTNRTASAEQTPTPSTEPTSEEEAACEPMKEYCNPPGANLLDDVLFNQSHDGSFENPICTLQPDGTISGKGCSAVSDQATHYQADTSALLPINSQAFYTEGSGYQKPEYVRVEVAGEQQCQEQLTSHGHNAFKIFSRGGYGLKGGLCMPMKSSNSVKHAGINFRVAQQAGDVSSNVPVTFRLGYINFAPQNNTYFSSPPSLSEGSISWVATETITSDDYGGEGAAARYAGGFLGGQLPGNAQGFCIMAESVNGNGIDTFWDGAFASTDANACENALDHSDGVDRSCGGYLCGNVDPTYSGNTYTDFDQDYYTFDMPPHWTANQCHYESETNGADSPYGALFVGLDINSCDINYQDKAQRNLHPEWQKADVICSDNRNWTYGYAWTGGVKDFGLLQYLDCAMGTLSQEGFKGTDSNPFFCNQILKAYANNRSVPRADDPAFTIRYSNTYSGLASGLQAEGQHFWKVPLLGSAIGVGIINNYETDEYRIDPFLIGNRNSGSGLNNLIKYNLGETADYIISQRLRTETHLYTDSIVSKNEVLVEDLLPSGPVCTNIQGDPITKIHYGSSNGVSDRAVFGFADDEGSSEHIIHAENIEITPEELCNFQFKENRVVGATCTFLDIGERKNVTFTEDNIGKTLLEVGLVGTVLVPTHSPPMEPGIPLPGYEECPGVNLCGTEFKCGGTMRELYDACIATRQVDQIGGNPFIRQELPNGWQGLQLHGLNKLLEATWHNEYKHYNYAVRHENVGIDVNQVVSIYDQQQPKCTALSDDRKPAYCNDDPVINKAAQVCRRVSPYDCGCNASNFATCMLDCPAMFQPPLEVPTLGLEIEGTPLPTPTSTEEKVLDNSIRSILNNTYPSFLERFVRILQPKTNLGEEGALNYRQGEVYNYNPRYTGGFLLANTGSGTTQCTSDNSAGTKTGVSQARLENYYAYVGQIPRMNERIGFAATNNKDPETYSGEMIDIENSSVAELISYFVVRGEGKENLAIPYCDLMTETEKLACQTSTDQSCDCLVRSCTDQLDAKVSLMEEYLPVICKKLTETEKNDYYGRPVSECYDNLSTHWEENVFKPAFERCEETPKNNLNFNCDPMANYLINQGFDTPELRFAACEDMLESQQCNYDKFGIHLITGPGQQDNYTRAENLGLKWKMEVITEDTPEMIDAMAQSVNSFSGKTVFRFCNADQGEPGSKVQDQSCAFRTELTGSSEASGEKAANMILSVAGKTTKPFLVAPINEPISEHWAGGDPNDDSNAATMSSVSAFYQAFASKLNSDSTLRSKIEIGGPTYNVTAFGNYANFERFHSEFSAKDIVDYWTINIYNHDDLPADISLLETQYNHVKNVFNDSKLIGINETGDFQHNVDRLKTSFSAIGSDSRLKYALLFNAFGGWGDDRGTPLVLTNIEIQNILAGNQVCRSESENMCLPSIDVAGLFNPLSGERKKNWELNQCYGPTNETQLASLPPFTPADRALIEQCKQLKPALGIYTNINYGNAEFGYFHSGLDLDSAPADEKIPVYSAGSGKVARVVESYNAGEGYGINVVIDHGGVYTLYGHLDNVLKADGTKLTVGEAVTRDTQIGRMGTTGNSTGVHLHFEVRKCLAYTRNCFIDPTSVMQSTYTRGGSTQPPSGDIQISENNQCHYGDIGSGSFENYECLMVSTSNLANSLPGGKRIPWQVLWAILYSESWHKCSESHVKHNQTGLTGASLLGYTRSGDPIYEAVDKCTGNPNQLALHLDANLVDKIGRGVGQFIPSTFDYYSATSDWQYCASELGVQRNEQSTERYWDPDGDANSFNTHRTGAPDFFGRARVGDSLCAATIKIAEDNKRYAGNYISPESWTEAMVRNAAEKYHGSCGKNGSYCNLVYDRYLFAIENFKDLTCNASTIPTPTPPIITNAPQPL